MADASEPWCGLRPKPVRDRHSAASRENIDETSYVEVDDPERQQRRVLGGGGEERRLVQPDPTGCAEAEEVINPWPAMIPDGGHRCVPGHPEVPGGLSDRVLRWSDPSADLRSPAR